MLKKMSKKRIAVIGGGASGLCAAIEAARTAKGRFGGGGLLRVRFLRGCGDCQVGAAKRAKRVITGNNLMAGRARHRDHLRKCIFLIKYSTKENEMQCRDFNALLLQIPKEYATIFVFLNF